MDRVTVHIRSKNMAAVRSSNNKTTELRLIWLFRRAKISGWRRKARVYGKPDFIFQKNKLSIFVDGCFWHGCKKCKTIPKQNRSFWLKKILSNQERDKLVSKTLRRDSWKVVRIWEHDLKALKCEAVLKRITKYLAQKTKS